MSEQSVEFFFDVSSPYSYLAAAKLMEQAHHGEVPVRWRPFLLGAVFKASGNHMPAAVQAKARWMLQDLRVWATHYGVPFRMTSRFPLNSLLAQRALVAAELDLGQETLPKLALALFRAAWVDDLDIAAPSVLTSVLNGEGVDGAALVAATGEQRVKDALRATTDESVERGAFGAPTFFIGERMYWGNDRLQFVLDAIA